MRKLMLPCALVCALFVTIAPVHAQNGDVVTTNYPKPGDTQAAPAISLFPPDYGNYSNMETDPVAVSAAERDALLERFKAALPAGIGAVSVNKWDDAQENSPAVQIVNNVPIKGATYTLFLPAGWNKAAKLPVMLSGNGAGTGNNQRLWKGGDLFIAELVGRSSAPGHTGMIAAYSNAGGVESQGVDDHTYQSVGAFFDFIGKNGGDPQRAITAGGSRGGVTALMWAINPLNLPYSVMAVFADIPPVALGTLSQRSVVTYPNLGYIYVAIAHLPNAYLYSSPYGPTKANLRVIIGANNPAEADARSPQGLAARLKGKTLVIGRGTHDAFFPLWEFLRFDRTLDSLGITHTTLITLGQGHRVSSNMLIQITRFTDDLTQGKAYAPPPGRFYYINQAPPDGPQVPLSAFKADPVAAAGVSADAQPGGDLPFTAEFAISAGVGNPVDLAICGKMGAAYTYRAQAADGTVWTHGEGALTTDECFQTTVTAPDKPGDYAWTFTYNGKEIPANYTPQRNQGGCGLPAVTTIVNTQPSPAELNGDDPSLSFGLDEFSAQDSACLVN